MKKQALATLFISMFAVMAGVACIAPFLSIYAMHFGASGVQVSLIFIGFHLSRTIFSPSLGRYSDLHGRRSSIAIGLFLYLLTSIAYIVANNIWGLFLVRFLQGAAAAMVLPVVLAYIGEISPPEKEGSYMGIFNISFFSGLAFGPIIGGFLYDLAGMKATFYFLGAFSLLSLVMVVVFLPREEPWRQVATRRKKFLDFPMWQDGLVRGITVLRGAVSFGVGLNWSFLPLYAEQVLNLNKGRIGLVLSMNVLVSAILQGPAGLLADKIDRRRLAFLGALISAIGLGLIPWCDSYLSLLVVNTLIGISSGLALPSIMALSAQAGRKHGMGAVMGTVTAGHSIGIIAGSMTGGFMFDFLGFSQAYILSAIVCTAGSLYFFVSLRGQR